jgi:hypothetical protein
VVGIVVGVIVEGADVSGGEKLDAAAETSAVGGPAGVLEGAQNQSLIDRQQFQKGVRRGFVGRVGVQESGGGRAGGVVGGLDELVKLVGEELFVRRAQVVVDVMTERRGCDIEGVEPL